jgi:hypothetical protein
MGSSEAEKIKWEDEQQSINWVMDFKLRGWTRKEIDKFLSKEIGYIAVKRRYLIACADLRIWEYRFSVKTSSILQPRKD